MTNDDHRSSASAVDRRELLAIGARAAAAALCLPALGLAGCGSGEERSAPSPAPRPPSQPVEPPPAPTSPTAKPVEPPPGEMPAPTDSSGGGTDGELVTEVAAVASLVTALQYVHQSPKPDQRCANCQLYTAGSGGLGKCQLFAQGLVKETGWCTSWVAEIT